MRRALLACGIGICLACGADAPTGSAGADGQVEAQANRPPRVELLAITPSEPTAEDALSAGLRVIDPDRDPLGVELTWFRNGSVHDETGRRTMDPGEFARDDRVWVEAEISDGSETVEVTSDPVTIGNAAPRVGSLRILPAAPTRSDLLEAELGGSDADGDPVRWSYRWFVDGEPVEGANTLRLAAESAARGARVTVEVSGNDGIMDGEWVASESVVIRNAAPKLLTRPVYGLASPGYYAYEVKAEDPDGDVPLRFELEESPPGMSIDIASGVISWPVPREAHGEYPVAIRVSDTHGGRTLQRYSLAVSWEADPEPGRAAGEGGERGAASGRSRGSSPDDAGSEDLPASESEDELEDDAAEESGS